jgi:hypothetical protein
MGLQPAGPPHPSLDLQPALFGNLTHDELPSPGAEPPSAPLDLFARGAPPDDPLYLSFRALII